MTEAYSTTASGAPDAAALEDLLSDLVNAETFHQDLNSCRNLLQKLAPRFEALGFEVILADLGARGVPSLRALRLSDGPRLLMLGHVDTVHPPSEGFVGFHPHPEDPEKAVGPGAADMKGGVVVLLGVLETLAAAGHLEGKAVEVLLVSDEELGSPDSEPTIKASAARADLCLTFEPGRPVDGWKRSTVVIARRGAGQVDVVAKGVPAHAGVAPEKGASAILELARMTLELTALGQREELGHVTVGTFSGGSSPNTVPAEARCSIDYRYDDAATGLRLKSAIQAILDAPQVTTGDGGRRVSVEVEAWHTRGALEPMPGVDAMRRFLQEEAGALGLELQEERRGGSSDAAICPEVGCPALCGLGVVGDHFHTHREWIFRRSLFDRVQLNARAVRRWFDQASVRPDRRDD